MGIETRLIMRRPEVLLAVASLAVTGLRIDGAQSPEVVDSERDREKAAVISKPRYLIDQRYVHDLMLADSDGQKFAKILDRFDVVDPKDKSSLEKIRIFFREWAAPGSSRPSAVRHFERVLENKPTILSKDEALLLSDLLRSALDKFVYTRSDTGEVNGINRTDEAAVIVRIAQWFKGEFKQVATLLGKDAGRPFDWSLDTLTAPLMLTEGDLSFLFETRDVSLPVKKVSRDPSLPPLTEEEIQGIESANKAAGWMSHRVEKGNFNPFEEPQFTMVELVSMNLALKARQKELLINGKLGNKSLSDEEVAKKCGALARLMCWASRIPNK